MNTPPRPSVPPRAAPPAGLPGWLAVLLLLWFMVLPAGAQRVEPTLPSGLPGPIEIRSAVFAAGQAAEGHEVTLPHTWGQDGLAPAGQGRYRLSFRLPERPNGVWALRLDRLASVHELRLNGQPISGQRPAESGRPLPLSRADPALIALPPDLLLAGHNVLRIEVWHSTRGGLSRATVGPWAELSAAHEHEVFLEQTLPLMLNGAGCALGLFLLLIGWRRRNDVLLGGFGLLWLLISLRWSLYVLDYSEHQGPWFDALMYLSQILSALLLGLLALALAERPHRPWRAVLLAVNLPLLLAGLPAAALGAVDLLRTWTYPLVLAAVLPPLALLARQAWQRRTPAGWAMLAALLLLIGSAAHDYLAWRGVLSVLERYWMPLLLPLVFSVFAWAAIERLVRVFEQVERFNLELEARVAERTRALEQAHQAKSRFLAAASHDLRQPVVAIGLLVDLLREHIQQPVQRRMIERVHEAIGAMEVLLKGLLDLSRLEAGTVQPRIESVSLQAVFDAIAPHAEEVARRRGLRLRLRPTRLAVRSDRVLLEQVLRNLVGNALRYTETGAVLVVARRRGTQVLLQVRDSGPGIAEDQRERIFEEFVQLAPAAGNKRPGAAAAPTDGGMGLGLGLAIVQRALRLLDHPLRLETAPGCGSCFSIRLDAGVAPPPPPAVPRQPGLPLRHWRIAVVDDDEQVRSVLSARLSAWGAVVETHAGLAGFRQRLALRPRGASGIDFLITDQRLIGATGLEVIDALRSYAGPVPALVITGDTDPADLARLARQQVPVLYKPFRAEALLERLLQLRGATTP